MNPRFFPKLCTIQNEGFSLLEKACKSFHSSRSYCSYGRHRSRSRGRCWRLRFNEYGIDGGPAAQALRPKYNLFIRRVTTTLGMELPKVEVKHIVAVNIALKGIGGLLFILSSSLGASLLLLHLALIAPILYDFYNHDIEKPEFAQLFVNFTQNLAFFGALLFYLGMKNSIPKRQGKKRAPKPKTL